MKRELERLAGQEHDVLVIGGGIHGAAVARACAGLGMRVALLEQGDFGQATSANSLKIIHGGLRYLQHLNFRRMRDSILARRDLLRFAPHYVRPLPCLIPNFGHGVRGNLVMRCALWLNDLIGWDRNQGVAADRRLPPGKVLAATEAGRLLAGISGEEPSGASLWYDVLAVNTERLTLALVQDAALLGAQAANYAQVTDILFDRGRVSGARLLDRLDGREVTVRAKSVVNAAGPWLEQIQSRAGLPAPPGIRWAKAVNIVVKKTFWPGQAVGLTGEPDFADQDALVTKKGRFFFFVPWHGYTMIGTTYKPFAGEPQAMRPETADVEELLREVNRMYPPAALTLTDVTRVHAGLVPIASQQAGGGEEEVQLAKESEVIEHGAADPTRRGLYSIKGVKYTTASRVALAASQVLHRYLAREYAWRPAKQKPAPGSGKTGQEPAAATVPAAFHFLEDRYGPRAALVHNFIRSNDLQLSQEPPLFGGEIDYFLAEEMALTLADVVFRRCELASAECPAAEVLESVARQMARVRHWDEKQIHAEISAVLDVFAPLHPARLP